MKNKRGIETYLNQSLQFGKKLRTLKNCLYYAKTVFRKVWRTTLTLIQTWIWFQISTGYQNRTQQEPWLLLGSGLERETWKKNYSQVLITYLYIPALQAQLLAERNREDRVVSTSSQWCQGITGFQESKDKITWQILRNAIAIKSDLSTFPRWRFCPDSEENWVHSCSVNPCSETKAGHATAEKNQKETTQNETLLSFGKVRKSRYQGVLQPLLCVQPPWALFH